MILRYFHRIPLLLIAALLCQGCLKSDLHNAIDLKSLSGVALYCLIGGSNSNSVSGTVSGLFGTGLRLQNNGTDEITVNENGSFTVPTPL